MGQIERMAEVDEGLRNEMEAVLLEAGAAKKCRHETLLKKGDAYEKGRAYAFATKQFQRGGFPAASSLAQVRQAVAGAIEFIAEECDRCEKERQE